MITIALAKGYLLKEAVRLFNQIGIEFEDDLTDSRKLFTVDLSGKYRILQVRPWDVSAYVEHGAADLGVVGFDVLYEKQENVVDLLDLGFGECRLVIAGPTPVTPIEELTQPIRVATKYPQSAERFFRESGKKVSLIKLYGAIELGPLTGLSDVICDLTATGTTLRENGLSILDTVFESTAHLIANPISMSTQYDDIVRITEAFRSILHV